MLRKDVYPYEHVDGWEKFNETTLLEKENIYSNLNMQNSRLHAWRKSDALLLADVFEKFRKMCLKIYQLDLE